MRFLILSQYFAPEIGAPQTRLAAMASELVRLGHEVEVVTALPNYPRGSIFPEYRKTLYRHEHWNGISIHRVWLYASVGRGLKRLLNYLSFTLTSFFGLFRARPSDYVFVESPPLFLAIPGFFISRLRGALFIFNVSDLWPDSLREMGVVPRGLFIRPAEVLEHWTYRKADYVVALTKSIGTRLVKEKRLPADKVLFLPNGVDTELFRPAAPDLAFKRALGVEGKKVVLYQGSEGYAHNLENVLHAAKLLESDGIHFLFVGDGSVRRHLEKLKQELQLNNLTFLDPVPKEDLPRFFSIADCGLVSLGETALFEGARPAKIWPIMSSGKPLLYVGKGEGAELVFEAKAGIVVPPGNHPEALAASTRALLNDPTLAAVLGRNGRAYVEKHMRWSSLIEHWLAALTNASVDIGEVSLNVSCRHT